mmetsp:Transcript_34111/g.77819  ORF Transcript_34111/g.77819 Transcript_34111/m.77819 type:complete len:242 (+) Transcript_34111:890-1615(+)
MPVQSTATAHITSTGSACNSQTSSASSRLHNLSPPSLAPDKSCFSFMLFDPYATCNVAVCVRPWSSSAVSFGNASPHQNNCKHEDGTPKCGSSLLLRDATVSALLAERLMRDLPLIVLTVSSTGPVGTRAGGMDSDFIARLCVSLTCPVDGAVDRLARVAAHCEGSAGVGEPAVSVIFIVLLPDTEAFCVIVGKESGNPVGSHAAASFRQSAMNEYGSSGLFRRSSSKSVCMNSCSRCLSR